MTEWSFFTIHARGLVCIAHDPGILRRDIAPTVGINERSAYAIVVDLTAGGYVVEDKNTGGPRNRYQIQTHLPLPENISGERTVCEILDLPVDATTRRRRRARQADWRHPVEQNRCRPSRSNGAREVGQIVAVSSPTGFTPTPPRLGPARSGRP